MGVHKLKKLSLAVGAACLLATQAVTANTTVKTPQVFLDVIKDAERLKDGGQGVVHASGHRNYTFTPNNGYRGTEVTFSAGTTYYVVEHGEYKAKTISQIAVDWGDGNMSQTFPGIPLKHKYGTRSSPSKNTVYTARVTFHTDDGNWYTEKFNYRLWVDRKQSILTGGRNLPHKLEEQVWCLGGQRIGDTCVTDFEFTRVVHRFTGCFDHVRFSIPVYDQHKQFGKKIFDKRNGASIVNGIYNKGYEVNSNGRKNEIKSAYQAYDVLSTNNTSHDHLSGLYYYFDPLSPDDPSINQPGMGHGEYRSHFVLNSALVSITAQQDDPSTRDNALNNYIYTQPSAANGWVAWIQLNHPGAGGAAPPCPYLHRGNNGWMRNLEITATYKGKVHVRQRPSSGSTGPKLPGGWFNREQQEGN